MKKDEHFVDQTLLTIYDTLCAKYKTNSTKYAKKAKATQNNYAELTRDDLKIDFNEEDFLKTAFLQYVICISNTIGHTNYRLFIKFLILIFFKLVFLYYVDFTFEYYV